MINAISESQSLAHLTYSPEENSSQKYNVADKITGLLNLPVELYHKIAWHLDAKDYASLRNTCSTLSDNLYSFSILDSMLKNNPCRGEFKIKSESMLKKLSIENIRKDDSLLTAIRTLRSMYICEEKNISTLDMKIPLSIDSEKKEDLFKTIESIREHIQFGFFRSCREIKKNEGVYVLSLALDMRFGNDDLVGPFPAQPFFSALQAIYDKKGNTNKYFIAVLAAELIQLWMVKPPRGSDKSTVMAINAQYSCLVNTGEMAKRIAREEYSASQSKEFSQ